MELSKIIKKNILDFIVIENLDLNKFLDDSNYKKYSFFELIKRNYNTTDAINVISKNLRIQRKTVGFCGNKDKNAITKQFISIKNLKNHLKKDHYFNDIYLKYINDFNKPLLFGKHKSNSFIVSIEVNDLNNDLIERLNDLLNKDIDFYFFNFFGEQRFGKDNYLIGKFLIKKQFKEALDLMIKTNQTRYISKFKNYKDSRDYVGIIKRLPKELLLIYVHAYQSFIFNKALSFLDGNPKELYIKRLRLPLLGFSVWINNLNLNEDIKKIYKKIIEEENINKKDFINKQIYFLTSTGNLRNAVHFTKIKIFRKTRNKKDYFIFVFKLPRSCYATVCLRSFIFRLNNKEMFKTILNESLK